MALPTPSPDGTSLVTGASSGIGAEIARLLAARGHGVTLVARRADRLEALAEELSTRHKIRAEVIAADLTDEDARAAIATTLAERDLRVDILVNNAGMSTFGAVQDADPAGDLTLVATNVTAVVHLTSLFVPSMAKRRSGAILNVASTAAFQPLPGQAAYGASKAFVLSYSHGLRAELEAVGIGVTVLCPGPVETGFAEAAGISSDDALEALPKFMWVGAPEVAKQAVDGMFAGRDVVIPGAPNRIGAAFGYLMPRKLLVPLLAKQHPALRARR